MSELDFDWVAEYQGGYNWVLNPIFTDGFEGWGIADADFTRTIQDIAGTGGGWYGTRFYRAVAAVTPSGSNLGLIFNDAAGGNLLRGLPGHQWTFSFYARPFGGATGRTIQIQITALDASDVEISNVWSRPTLAAGWNRYSISMTMPAATASFRVYVFDYNGTGGTFAVGDGIDIDAVMANAGLSAAPFTPRHKPLKWADGRNYDLAQFKIQTATPGFVIGEAIIGESLIGPDGPYTDITQDFTSMVVHQPTVVEDGLFVHREVDSCTITTTNPNHLELRGQRVRVRYEPKLLFRGTVVETDLDETVDIANPQRLGNTDSRTHRVSLRCTAGEEYFATTNAPARAFTTESLSTRVGSYTGLSSVVDFGNFADVDANVMSNVGNALADRWVTNLADPPRSLLETLRDLLKRAGRYYRRFAGDQAIHTESVSVPASGESFINVGLRFTDDPTRVGVPSLNYRHKTHEGRTVSYSNRKVSENPSLFTTGITVITGASGSEVTHGPFLTAGSDRRQDITLELGEINNSPRVPQTVRNFVATLPLKARPAPFTSRIRAPLQSTHQVQTRLPSIATVNRDGVDELVALLGMTHTITPRRWMVDYDCAPPHLLTRVGDYDPSPPRELTAVQAGSGGAVTLNWLSPDSIPTTRPIYQQVRGRTPASNFVGGFEPSDSLMAVLENVAVALPLAARTPRSAVIPFASLSAAQWQFWVQYTTDPTPGDSTFDATHLIGQPATVILTLT